MDLNKVNHRIHNQQVNEISMSNDDEVKKWN